MTSESLMCKLLAAVLALLHLPLVWLCEFDLPESLFLDYELGLRSGVFFLTPRSLLGKDNRRRVFYFLTAVNLKHLWDELGGLEKHELDLGYSASSLPPAESLQKGGILKIESLFTSYRLRINLVQILSILTPDQGFEFSAMLWNSPSNRAIHLMAVHWRVGGYGHLIWRWN
jgi:hypothetical protein